MKVIQKLLVGLLFLGSFAITIAQEGDRSPSFDDPSKTAIFPQFIVGRLLGFQFDIEQRIGNGSDLPFTGAIEIFRSNFSPVQGLMVNGQPYAPGLPINLGPKESLSLSFTQQPVPVSTPAPMGSCDQTVCEDLTGVALDNCRCLDCDDEYMCFEVDGVEVVEKRARPAGAGASVSDLTHSFFYNLRDAGGNLIDTVAVPEGRAGTGIRFVMSRRPGFDTGVAIFITIPQPVNISVYLPGGASPAGTTLLEGVNPLLTKYRDDFFLNEFVDGLPDVIDSALVEMTVGIGEIYGMALGVKVEGATVQLSGQNVTPFGLNGGAPFDAQ